MSAQRTVRLTEIVATSLLWGAVVLGSAVLALTLPVYTSAMTQALGVPESSGLPADDVVRLSGQVRALVADQSYQSLPAVWEGQPAFDAAAVSHLMDVRAVISGARLAVGLAALLLAGYTGWCVARRRLKELSAGMRAGAIGLAVGTVLALLVALTSFDVLFTAFHGIFFAAGTWTFPADSLLIRLFPERFWAVSGAAWAGLTLAGAATLAAIAHFLRVSAAGANASRTANNV